MKGWILGLLAAVTLVTAARAQPQTVRIGTEAQYAPFEYKDANGKLQGYEIQLGDALCARAKLTCEWVNMDFDSMIPALNAHRIDAILSQMSVTEERAKAVSFTDTVSTAPAQYIARKGAKITDDPRSLKGLTVGVQSGTTHETYANARLKGVAEAKIYQSQEEAFQDLQTGRIDATLCDQAIGYDWLKKAGAAAGYVQVGEPLNDTAFFGEGTAIALRKSDTALRDKLNAALRQVKQDGTFQKINDQYFPFSIVAK